MFEAVIALCIGTIEPRCRDQLLPGYEAENIAACQDALTARPPDPTFFAGDGRMGEPRCVPLGAPLAVAEIAPGIWVHMGAIAEPNADNGGDTSNLGFVIGDDSVAVIDTGGARWIGEGLWRAIRARTQKPVTHAILTHPHPDHVFGAGPFAEIDARIVGHPKLSRALLDRRANYLESYSTLLDPEAFLGTNTVEVTQTVDRSIDIDLGDRVLQLNSWQTAHTTADVTVYDKETATLFAGDLVFHRHIPALDGQLTGWQEVLSELSDMRVDRVVPGHGAPVVGAAQGFSPVGRYLDVLAADTRAAIDRGERLGDAVNHIARSEANHWDLFEAYNARNATVAFTELEWE